MRAYHMPSLPEMPLEHLHGGDPGIAETKPMKRKFSPVCFLATFHRYTNPFQLKSYIL
jgi:hypothetical protein